MYKIANYFPQEKAFGTILFSVIIMFIQPNPTDCHLYIMDTTYDFIQTWLHRSLNVQSGYRFSTHPFSLGRMLLFESILYKPSIGKSIQGVINLIKGSDNPFTYLESIDHYIRVVGFGNHFGDFVIVEYSSYDQMTYVRDLLLDCWSQFLILMKSVLVSPNMFIYRPALPNNVLYTNTCLVSSEEPNSV